MTKVNAPSLVKSSKELKEERAIKEQELETLLAGATEGTEKRDLEGDEITKYDALMTEIRDLTQKIDDTVKMEETRPQIAGRKIAQTTQKREVDQVKNYSFVKAIRSGLPGGKLEGFELEMDQEARSEASAFGTTVTGIGVPYKVLAPEKRTILAGTETDVIPTKFRGFIDILMAPLRILGPGCRVS